MARRQGVTAEQKTQLVLRLLRKEEPAAQIARQAGVSEQSLYRWREEFLEGGKRALEGKAGQQGINGATAQLQAQLADRDQVIGELTVANRILKKLSGSLS